MARDLRSVLNKPFMAASLSIDPGGGLPYETDGDARRLA